jgi:predicted Zn finger-like uncharacterized protein
MILTCPECATRFSIKTEAIGPNGRTVRCSQCSATWFVSADPDILSLNEIQSSPVQESLANEAVSDDLSSEPVDPIPEDVSNEPKEKMAPHTALRDKAEKTRVRRRLFGVSMIWISTLSILVLAALLAWIFRSQIVAKFPATQQVYSAFGVKASESGLEIFDVETRQGNSDGIPVLFVNGSVKNYDVKTRDIPLIKMSFKNANGEILTSWVIEPSKSRLESGQSLAFTSQYPNPPIDATKLAPSFVEEGGGGGNNIPMIGQ